MSHVFHLLLVWIFALFLQIEGGGGRCSPAKQAECEADWRTCLNEFCGRCILEIDGECYDPTQANGAVLERLVNCDPTVDPNCKDNLEDVSDQLLVQIGDINSGGKRDNDAKTKKDISANNLQSNSEVKQPRKLGKTLSREEKGDSVPGEKMESVSDETQENESAFSKKKPDKKNDEDDSGDIPDVYFVVIIIACTLSGMAGIALSGYCWYKLHHSDDKVSKGEYIAGVKKPSVKSTPSKNGDQKMDYKAEMYHYAQAKHQIAAMEKAKSDHLSSGAMSNDEDDDDDEVEDYTVYECPGLAPTGDMTVVNPLFSDQEVSVSDEGRALSTHSSPGSPTRSNHTPSR